jgi:hypothetical protein
MKSQEEATMMKRILVAAACVALLAPAAASAQEAATIVLRSGDRVSGQLIDHGGVGFTIEVSGQTRTIPTNDVVAVEFAGSPEPKWSNDLLSKLNTGQHVIWLKSGQAVVGRFYDIAGTRPLRITVDTEGGRRDYTSNDVARIYLAAPSGSRVGTTGEQASEPGTVTVAGNQEWTPTGITVRRGEVVTFRTTGEVQLSADANDKAQAAGAFSGRKTANAPVPEVIAGALIARIGNGRPFPIGDQTEVPMPAGGQLFLGINDDAVGDNVGQFRVTIERRVDRRRRR